MTTRPLRSISLTDPEAGGRRRTVAVTGAGRPDSSGGIARTCRNQRLFKLRLEGRPPGTTFLSDTRYTVGKEFTAAAANRRPASWISSMEQVIAQPQSHQS